MLTRADIPQLLLAGFKTDFQKGYGAIPSIYQDFTMEVASTKNQETYPWLGSTPAAREWVGERQAKALSQYAYTLPNLAYEATIAVDRYALDDDQYGQVRLRVTSLGEEAKRYYDVLAAATVEAGTTTICYDGQYFFDVDHTDKGSYQTNQSNSPAAAAGYVFGAPAVKTALTAMRQFKNDEGKIAGIQATHVMVPTDLEFTARQLFDPSALANAIDPTLRVLSGYLKIIVNPYLTNGGTNSAWYVMDLSKSIRPFIFQNRKAPEFVALDQPNSTANFMSRQLFYGVDFRCAFGYGDWRLAFRAQGA